MCCIPTWKWTLFDCQTTSIGWGKQLIGCQTVPIGRDECVIRCEHIRTHGGSRGGRTVWAGDWWELLWEKCKNPSVDMQSIRLVALQPQGEKMRGQWTRQAIRYAPGMYQDHGQGGDVFQRWPYFIYSNTSSYRYWRSSGQWGGHWDVLPRSGSSYRAAGSDCGKHLWGWDGHQASDGRAGSSGGCCGRRVSTSEPWMTATGTPRHIGSTGRRDLTILWRTISNPGSWIFLHTTPYVVPIEN